MDLGAFVIRLGLALFLGALIGLERQWRHRMAGTRTNALVATASAAFTMIGLVTSGDGSAARIVGQIVSGVGFLGAGVIFKEGANVRGLNTAATVWCAAAVGALSGIGYSQYAVVTAVAVVLTNVALRPLANVLQAGMPNGAADYDVELICDARDETQIRALLLSAIDRNHMAVSSLHSEGVAGASSVRVAADIKSTLRNDECMEQLAARLTLEPSVSSIKWRFQQPSLVD